MFSTRPKLQRDHWTTSIKCAPTKNLTSRNVKQLWILVSFLKSVMTKKRISDALKSMSNCSLCIWHQSKVGLHLHYWEWRRLFPSSSFFFKRAILLKIFCLICLFAKLKTDFWSLANSKEEVKSKKNMSLTDWDDGYIKTVAFCHSVCISQKYQKFSNHD